MLKGKQGPRSGGQPTKHRKTLRHKRLILASRIEKTGHDAARNCGQQVIAICVTPYPHA